MMGGAVKDRYANCLSLLFFIFLLHFSVKNSHIMLIGDDC